MIGLRQGSDRNILINITEDITITLIYCPPGVFLVGSHNRRFEADSGENDLHEVKISKGFWISEAPLTRRQYMAVSDGDVTNSPQKLRRYEKSLESPASQHTWEEAIAFCNILNGELAKDLLNLFDREAENSYRFTLPSEAQWEYACRAGTTTIWYFGNDEGELSDHAWYGLSTSTKLPEVKLKKPNPWGLYDLYGMVYEWCLDDISGFYKMLSVVDPIFMHPMMPNSTLTKVTKGGAIYDAANFCSSASHTSLVRWNSENDLTGIRLVISQSRI